MGEITIVNWLGHSLLTDMFDLKTSTSECARVFAEVEKYRALKFLLLTKRPENWMGILPTRWLLAWPKNVRLGFIAEDQRRFDERLRHAANLRCAFIVPKVFVSYKPAIGELSITSPIVRRNVDWVICGGESDPYARPMKVEWARLVRDQCQAQGIPFFFEQWGDWFEQNLICACTSPAGWTTLKPHGGNLLDGREWQQFPEKSAIFSTEK